MVSSIQYPQTQVMYAPRQMYAPQQQMVAPDGQQQPDPSNDPTQLEQQLQAQQAYAQQRQEGVNPLQKFWNGLPQWAQWTAGIAGAALVTWGGSKVLGNAHRWPGQVGNFFKGAPLKSQELKDAHIEHERTVKQRESSESAYQASQKALESHESNLTQVEGEWKALGFWERSWFGGMIGNRDARKERQQLVEKRRIAKQTHEEAASSHRELEEQRRSHIIMEHEARETKIETELNLLTEKLPQINERINQTEDDKKKKTMEVTRLYAEQRIQALKADLATTRVHLSSAESGQWPPQEGHPFESQADKHHEQFKKDYNYAPSEPGFFGKMFAFLTGGHDWTEHPMQTYKPATA